MNAGQYQVDDDRPTDHGEMRHVQWHVKRILPRRIFHYDILEKKVRRCNQANEANYPIDCSRLKNK